jgi:hypothetical protein
MRSPRGRTFNGSIGCADDEHSSGMDSAMCAKTTSSVARHGREQNEQLGGCGVVEAAVSSSSGLETVVGHSLQLSKRALL